MKKNKMLYRIVAAVLACAVVALALVTYQSRSSSNAPVAEGAVTATGSAKGMEGDVVVEVTADATTIYSITVKEQNETQGIGSVVCEQLPDTMVAANSYNVATTIFKDNRQINSDAIILKSNTHTLG